jgi:hypothetical protein
MSARQPGLSRDALSAGAAAGAALYALAAALDAAMTIKGLGGDASLEGNAALRSLMATAGIRPALALAKLSTGFALWSVAFWIGRAIHDEAPWIEKVPTLPVVRRWLRSGDRCWVALVPLYAVAAAQLFAACLWLSLR